MKYLIYNDKKKKIFYFLKTTEHTRNKDKTLPFLLYEDGQRFENKEEILKYTKDYCSTCIKIEIYMIIQ